jgi:beta-lactamase regulating signal transducer with metallopeptidase domain
MRDLLGSRLLEAAARGAVVLLAALVLTALLHRRSAATRHAIWVGAIAVQLMLPVLALWGPRWHVAAPEAMSALVPVRDLGTSLTDTVATPRQIATPDRVPAMRDSAPRAPNVSDVRAPTPAPRRSVSARSVWIGLWALGAAVVLLRLAIGTVLVARLARHGTRVDDGGWLSLAQRLATTLRIQRPLILLRGTRVGVPITWGVVYPIVLLPDDADEWPDERRRYVLVHEMAHVKRFDALTQLVGQLALATFWFNPLIWIANRRMQLEREHACDDYVLRHGTQPSRYAADLLEMVQSLGTPAHRAAQPAFAALAMARRTEFEGRMLSILDPVLDRHPLNRGRTLMSAFATLFVVVPLAAVQPYRPAAPASAPALHASAIAAHAESTTGRQGVTVADSHSAARVAPPATKAAARHDDSCDAAQFRGSDNVSLHLHDDVDERSARDLKFLSYDRDHCVQASIRGRFTTSPDEDRIVAMTPGSRIFLRERRPGSDLALEITPVGTASSDNLIFELRRDGVEAPYDAAARGWVAGLLPSILAEASINVGPRVTRWRAQGGTDGVLRHIAELRSSGAKRAHYTALLDEKQLASADVERVVRQAGRTVPSSGDLRAVLSKAAPQIRTSAGSASTLREAIGAVASSGDRTAVLESYGTTDDRDQLVAVMQIAESIPSSGDKSGLLVTLAPRYLARNDAALRQAYFATAITIPSSGDLARVLETAVPFATKSNDIALAVISAAPHVASSGDRADVLTALANAGAVHSAAVREAYLRTAQDVPSSGDMRRVLEALTRN